MDNASKALVMAGAILIAVMLISLGVLLFTRARDIANDATSGIDRQTITAYNNEWLNYEGTRKSASDIRSLIQAVNSQNNNADSVYKYGEIKLKTNGTDMSKPAGGSYSSSKVGKNSRYEVTITGYSNTGGAVSEITISGDSLN